VISLLQKAGLHVTAVQNPLTSLADDAKATRRILALQDGPTVLVAHSYGGMVISQAGIDPKVSALVYVAARGPDAGEDYGALAARFPAAPASAGLIKSADGRVARQAELVCHVDPGPHHQSGPAALHGEAHERPDHRSGVQPPVADVASAGGRRPDPEGGRHVKIFIFFLKPFHCRRE
jgi:pimeloyl-ACP methyl ester carboxylesterase